MSEGALSTITCIEILFSYVHTVQQQDIKGKQSLYNQYGRVMLFSKVLIYGLLILWFWSAPVTTVPKHLLQPFGMLIPFHLLLISLLQSLAGYLMFAHHVVCYALQHLSARKMWYLLCNNGICWIRSFC
jgi:hypothetical protein